MRLDSLCQQEHSNRGSISLIASKFLNSRIAIGSILVAAILLPVVTYSPNRNSIPGKTIKAAALILGGSTGKFVRETVNHNSSILNLAYNYAKAYSKSLQPDNITLDIPLKSFNKLKDVKEEALGNKAIIRKDLWVNAVLSSSGSDSPIPVRIRIKGDLIDHLQNGNWSFRVKTRKSSNYMGMKVFSIQPAITRSYIYESIFHNLLRNEGLPFLRYDFKRLIINGRDHGIYAIEESFAKEAIEHSRFRDSVIVRFNEDNFFSNSIYFNKLSEDFGEDTERLAVSAPKVNQYRASIRSFNESRLEDYKGFSKAVNLLGSYLAGTKSASEVFDLDAMASFYAVTDLLKTWHARRWHNMRFYLEPISGKLVPFGFDASFAQESDYIPAPLSGELNLFEDIEFTKKYVRKSEEISSKKYLDRFFENHRDLFDSQLNILHKSFPFLGSFEQRVRVASELVRLNIAPSKDPFIVKISPLPNHDSNRIRLLFSSHSSLPIRLSNLVHKGAYWKPINSGIIPAHSPDLYNKYTAITFERISQAEPKDATPEQTSNSFKFRYSTLGSVRKFEKTYDLLPTISNDSQIFKPSLALSPQYSESLTNPYPRFFDLELDSATLTFKEPETRITTTLRIPSGFTIKLNAGSTLRFLPGASLISRSPLKFLGTSKLPIRITGSKDSGILVLNTKSRSTIHHVYFSNLSALVDPVHTVTGAVNFFKAPVEITNSIFARNNSEDSLNIFRSEFSISKSIFSDSYSDGLDVDFSDGSIVDVEFSEIGNDALDFSGSQAQLNDIVVVNARDKVLSAGENSTVRISGLFASDSGVGITSKDSSVVYVKNAEFSNLDVCMTAFNKKPVYGGAKIHAVNLPSGCKEPFLVEPSSIVSIGGKKLASNALKVEDLMYGRKYGRATEK